MHWIERLRNSLKKRRNETGRQYLRSVVAVIVFSAIVLVFVMFGYTGRQTESGQLARVGNRYITIQEYQAEIDRLQRMYAGMFGGQMSAETQRQFFQSQALESLVSQEVIAQGALENGILIPDAEIRNIIFQDVPAFQEEGKFNKEQYFAVLEANHFTASDFERKLKQEKLNEKLRDLFDDSFIKSKLAIEKQKSLASFNRRYSWVVLDEAVAKKKLDVAKSDKAATPADQKSKLNLVLPKTGAEDAAPPGDTEWKKTWADYLKKVETDSKTAPALNQDLANAGLNWTTEDANLSEETLPKLGSAAASKRAFELENAGQTSGVIQDGARHIVVRLDQTDVPSSSPGSKGDAADPSADSSEQSNEVFSAWLEREKSSMKIERNASLLSSLK